jgi:four helix bundle protein
LKVVTRIERFEDVQAWQAARELANAIYDASRNPNFERDFRFRDQIRAAAVSVMSNIAEGFESQGNRNFIRYLYLAKGSAGEVRAQLYVALDQGYITQEQFDALRAKSEDISRLLAGFIRYLSQHTDR